MNLKVKIVYCTSWGYLDKAVSLTRVVLGKFKNSIESVEICPSSGGVFDVFLNDKEIFSKIMLGRYPHDGEIEELIQKQL